MRFLVSLVSLLFSATLSAQSVSFLPPAPTTADSVIARATGTWPHTGAPSCGDARVLGRTITVTVRCDSPVGGAVPTRWTADVVIGTVAAGTYDVIVQTSSFQEITRSKLTVREAAPAFRVVPEVASGDGLEEVRIVGTNVGAGTPTVRFGGSPATVTRVVSPNEIVVRLPQHAPGTVDVTVSNGNTTLSTTAAFHFYFIDGTRDLAFFEPVLFPVIFNGPGPFGAQWDTEVAMHNTNEYMFGAPENVFTPFCFPGCDPRIQARTTYLVLAHRRPDGLVDYYPRQAMPGLNFNVTVRDLSRGDQNLGSEVPVLREDDLYDRTFAIVNIPVDPRYRITLRLYDTAGPSSVRLRINKINTETPFVDTIVNLGPNPERGAATAIIGSLVDTYPQLAGRGPLRIEITPLVQPTTKSLWAMVSITNNSTNQITVMSPH